MNPKVLLALFLFICSCGSSKVINGVEHETYGLINADSEKCAYVKYKPIWGNIIWGALLVETIIAPIYFYGFSMFEPTRENCNIEHKCGKVV